MRKLTFIALLFVGALAVLVTPAMSKAELTADCTVTSSDPLDVVTEFTPPSNPPNPSIAETVVGEMYTVETGAATYDVACTLTSDVDLNSAPMLMAGGFEIDHDTFAVTQTSSTEYAYAFSGATGAFYPPDNDPSVPNQEFVMVYVATGTDPSLENPEQAGGPPASMGGGYISTTVQEFQITPPSNPNDFGFGLTLSGPEGVTGFFNMYMPSTMLDLMSTMSGKTITVADMAVYIDDMQASTSITETAAGGALINIDITFTSGDTSTTSSIAADDGTITKSIEAKEQQDLSIALTESVVTRKHQTTLYGWLASGLNHKKIKIYQKKVGHKKYTLVKQKRTNEEGYYAWTFKAKKQLMKKGEYKFKAKYGSTYSDVITLTVN